MAHLDDIPTKEFIRAIDSQIERDEAHGVTDMPATRIKIRRGNPQTASTPFSNIKLKCPWSRAENHVDADPNVKYCDAFRWGGGTGRLCSEQYCGLLAVYEVLKEEG